MRDASRAAACNARPERRRPSRRWQVRRRRPPGRPAPSRPGLASHGQQQSSTCRRHSLPGPTQRCAGRRGAACAAYGPSDPARQRARICHRSTRGPSHKPGGERPHATQARQGVVVPGDVAVPAGVCLARHPNTVPLGERVAERWYQDHQLLEPDLVSTSEGKAGDHPGAGCPRCSRPPPCAPGDPSDRGDSA